MFSKLAKLFGGSDEKVVAKLRPKVNEINALEPEFERMSDDDLQIETQNLRRAASGGESLDALLPRAFAAIREAAKRALGQRHYDVQLIGGVVLHQGKIAEMKTGEGKTLVATLPAYLNALSGRGVHVVTVNDYLARRDAHWMGAVYDALGVSVGALQNRSALIYDPFYEDGERGFEHMRPATRKEAYAADVTYGTNNEFGFDYLRDNMAPSRDDRVQRERAYGIVDEVDNILIDEARTPLIISGPSSTSARDYLRYAKLAPTARAGARLHARRKAQDGGAHPRRHHQTGARAERPEPLRRFREGSPHRKRAEGAGDIRERPRLRRPKPRSGHRRRVHRADDDRSALFRRAASGDRGERGRPDTPRIHHIRHDNAPKLLPPLRKAVGHDRHRRHGSGGIRQNLQAGSSGDSDQPPRWFGRTCPTSSTRTRTRSSARSRAR